jgi:hypothetical protein
MFHKPPGLLISMRGKLYPFWYSCTKDQIREVVASHLKLYSRERVGTTLLEQPNEVSIQYAEQIGLPEPNKAPASAVSAKLREMGHEYEARFCEINNANQTRVIPLEEFQVLWVTRFKFVNDRANKNVAEADRAEVVDLKKLFG